jgi:hypothetical protein
MCVVAHIIKEEISWIGYLIAARWLSFGTFGIQVSIFTPVPVCLAECKFNFYFYHVSFVIYRYADNLGTVRAYLCEILFRRVRKLALTSPTNGGRSVDIVRSRTEATEFSLFYGTLWSARYLSKDTEERISSILKV